MQMPSVNEYNTVALKDKYLLNMLEKSTTSVFMHAHKYKSTILQLFYNFY